MAVSTNRAQPFAGKTPGGVTHETRMQDMLRAGQASQVVEYAADLPATTLRGVAFRRLLAAAYAQTGAHKAAAAELARALPHAGEDAAFLEQFGAACMVAKEHMQAASAFLSLSKLQPDLARPLVSAAMSLRAAGNFDDARFCLHEARQRRFDTEEDYLRAARIAGSIGETGEAVLILGALVEAFPNDASHWATFARAAWTAGKGSLALQAVEQSVNVMPTVEGLLTWADIRRETRDPLGSLDLCRKALALDDTRAECHLSLGRALQDSGRTEDAIASFERCLALQPDHEIAYVNLGEALTSSGRQTEGVAAYQKAFDIAPHDARIAQALVEYSPSHRSPEMETFLASVLTDPAADHVQKASASYGLARIAEQDKRFADTVSHLDNAGRHRNAANGAPPLQFKDEFERIKTLCHGPLPVLAPSPAPFVPIFVLGMPRSGTTLVSQILSRHAEVETIGESAALTAAINASGILANGVTEDALSAVRAAYFSWITKQNSPAKPYVVDKMPGNVRFLGLIAAAFPEARIVVMDRDAMAVCWSCFRTNFVNEKLAYSNTQQDMADYFLATRSLVAFWDQTWPDRWRHQSYEALTERPEDEVAQLLNHIGLPPDPAVLDPAASGGTVRTASLTQVRKPIYRGSSKVWQSFAASLTPMIARLEDGGVAVDKTG